MVKKCAVCGREFETGRGSRKYCSDGCRYKAMLEMSKTANRERKRKKPKTGGFDADDRLAKEMGVSYGKLQAMRYAGLI